MQSNFHLFKKSLLSAGRRLGVYVMVRRARRRCPAVLMFHGFTENHCSGLENSQHKHLHVEKFESILKLLAAQYRVISLSELVKFLSIGPPPPPGSVVLTFDDGFLSNYTLAFPLLKKYNLPASIFIATEFVGEKKPIWVDRIDYALGCEGKSRTELVETKRRLKSLPSSELPGAVQEIENRSGHRLEMANDPGIPATFHAMDWAHAREMKASGLIEFGAHTHSHIILGRCPLDLAEMEIAKSKSIIERELGGTCDTFCYPNGSRGDFSHETEAILKRHGFQCTLTTIGGLNPPGCSPYLMKRLGVTNDLSLLQFEMMMCGLRS